MASKYKICRQCGNNKNVTNFRLRKESRRSYKVYYYRNNLCRQCEKMNARKYHEAWKDEESYKEKNRKRAGEFRKENLEIVKERDRKRRQGLNYKQWRKKYSLKNKHKIYLQEKICKKRYYEYQKNNLTYAYVIRFIIQRTNLTKEQVLKNPQLIETWRLKMKINRIIKSKNEKSKNG